MLGMLRRVDNMTKYTWAKCDRCKRDFRSRTAKICKDCLDAIKNKSYGKNKNI